MTQKESAVASFVAVALGLLSWGCAGDGATAPSSSPTTRTVALITIDTWRQDATGFLGGSEPSPTPFLDGLARGGWVATDAVAPVPLTGPSHWSMLTGRWPWRDGMRVNGDRPDHGGAVSVAEILQDHGWRTAAFVSSAPLDHRFGFGAGFEHYDDPSHGTGRISDVRMPERRGDATVDAARAWLSGLGSDERLFLWVHLFDPHFPYDAPREPFPGARGAYEAEVAFADEQLGRLAEGLEAVSRPLAESLWLVLSDHGEALGEHGETTHGLLLHGATTRIPLLVAGPGVPNGRVGSLVSTVDVMPTILGHLGLEPPDSDGLDLLHSPESADRSIPLESMLGASSFGLAPAYGIRSSSWLWEASPADHLWDLAADPREEHDLAATRPKELQELRGLRRSFGIEAYEQDSLPDRETMERLRSLGYVGSGSRAGTGDLREFSLEGADRYFRIMTLLREARYAEAEALTVPFLQRYPGSLSMWIEGGFVAVGLGDLGKAESRFRRALEINAASMQARLNLANVLWMAGRNSEAEAEYLRVLESDPEDLFALYNLGALLWPGPRRSEARDYWERFLELYPDHEQAAEVRLSLQGEAPAPNRSR